MGKNNQAKSFSERLRFIFNGRSTISRQSSPAVSSPKSPAPRLGLSILSSPTIDLPGLLPHVSTSLGEIPSPRTLNGAGTPTSTTRAAPLSARSTRSHSTVHSPSPAILRFDRSSPNTNRQSEHVRGSLRGTRRRRRTVHGQVRRATKSIFRERLGRMKLMRCLGLGLILAVGLTVYLALASSDVINGLQVHIFMIVVGIIMVMAFAHATVRLCMYILRPPRYPVSRTVSNATLDPEVPIPVILRRDEELSENETDGVPKDALLPSPPPAYGFWRSSTRMNPNLIHWRRVETLQGEAAPTQTNTLSLGQPSSPYRPPSYTTEPELR